MSVTKVLNEPLILARSAPPKTSNHGTCKIESNVVFGISTLTVKLDGKERSLFLQN